MFIKSSGKIDGYYERQKIDMVADSALSILVTPTMIPKA